MRTAFVALLAILFAAIPAIADAKFTNAATPAGVSVGTGTLPAPKNVTVPATSTGSVPVTWSAPSGAPAGVGYFVTRTSGATTSAACGTNATTLISTTSCTDTVSTGGTYTYTVTVAFQRWTAASAASNSVAVSATAGQLDVTQNPQSAKSEQSLGAVIVQLRSNTGTALTTSGVQVTVTLTGSTSGTRTATTGSNGTATFNGLSVDLAGTYTLTATATNCSPDQSTSFTITAGDPTNIDVASGSGQSTRVHTTFASPLVALVTDDAGNPVSGANVTFIAPASGGASGTFSNNNTTANAVTKASGQASVTLKANGVRGTYQVLGRLSGLTFASFTLTNT